MVTRGGTLTLLSAKHFKLGARVAFVSGPFERRQLGLVGNESWFQLGLKS